jgi:hypothetical protein
VAQSLLRTVAVHSTQPVWPVSKPGGTEVDRRGAELLFQVLTERKEKNAAWATATRTMSLLTKLSSKL